jgi:hypothetical protein
MEYCLKHLRVRTSSEENIWVKKSETGGWKRNYIMWSFVICTLGLIYGDLIRMGSTCVMYSEVRHAYKILIGKPKGKRLFGRTTCR